jgi:hypothetical protein
MFLRTSIASISGFLNLAGLPFRRTGPRQETDRLAKNAGRIALIRETARGDVEEAPLFCGDPKICQPRAVEMIQRGERLVVEGFPVETITRWCIDFNYRWRLHPSRGRSLKFILEPLPLPTAPGES